MDKVKRKPSLKERIAVTVIVTVTLLIVAVVVFPFFARSHDPGRRSECPSNLKQIGLGIIQYVQDYDEKWPSGADHWAGAIYSYEKSTGVYHCPDDNVQGKLDPPAYRISYAMNANLPGHSDDALSDPSHTVLALDIADTPLCDFTEQTDSTSQYTTGTTANTAWGGVRLGTTADVANPPRHDPSIMFLACDGHVKLMRPEKVSSGVDNPSSTGAQDATHAAGTKGLAVEHYTLTFSEK